MTIDTLQQPFENNIWRYYRYRSIFCQKVIVASTIDFSFVSWEALSLGLSKTVLHFEKFAKVITEKLKS